MDETTVRRDPFVSSLSSLARCGPLPFGRTNASGKARTGAIIGAGAQGRIVAEIWRAMDCVRSLVLVDENHHLWRKCIGGVPVVGDISGWVERHAEGIEAVIAVGHNPQRLELARRLAEMQVQFARVVHPSAVIMRSASLGVGVMVLPQCVVNTGAQVGDHVVLNTGVIVEHDCFVEEGASLSPGTRMGGRVAIGRGAFLGTGTTCLPRVTIGQEAIVGAGSLVAGDIPRGVVAYGVPARVIRPVTPRDWARLL